jgi:site-specific DNA-methyltransferase (adenine-specific)
MRHVFQRHRLRSHFMLCLLRRAALHGCYMKSTRHHTQLALLEANAGASDSETNHRPSKKTSSNDGNVYGSSQLLHGDAFDLIPTIQDNSIDLLITSPPYWGLRTYDQSHNWDILKKWKSHAGLDSDTTAPNYEWYRNNGGVLGLEPLPEWYIYHLVEIINKVAPKLKAGGSLWVNIGDTYFARWSSIREKGRQGLGDQTRTRRRTPMGGFRQEKQLLMIPARFAIAMQEHRWIIRNDLIWFKPNIPPRPELDRLRLSHEHFFHFVKRSTLGRPKYYYALSDVERGAHDVVECSVRPGEDGHTATFPSELIRPRILSSCPVGGIVLDPFAGTGRALIEAVSSGRNAIGIEISENIIQIARRVLGSPSEYGAAT